MIFGHRRAIKKKKIKTWVLLYLWLYLCHASPYLVLTKTNEADLICIFRSFFKTDRFKCLDNRCSLLFYEGHKFCTRMICSFTSAISTVERSWISKIKIKKIDVYCCYM